MSINATEEESYARLINHSKKKANLLPKLVTVDNTPRLIFIAKNDIDCGEELLYDYGDRTKESIKSHPWLLL